MEYCKYMYADDDNDNGDTGNDGVMIKAKASATST